MLLEVTLADCYTAPPRIMSVERERMVRWLVGQDASLEQMVDHLHAPREMVILWCKMLSLPRPKRTGGLFPNHPSCLAETETRYDEQGKVIYQRRSYVGRSH